MKPEIYTINVWRLADKITKVEFLVDLTLMCDALQELSEISVELQVRDISLCTAYKELKMQIHVFEDIKCNSEPHNREAFKAAENLKLYCKEKTPIRN
jgi:hypothetical protein